jgi:phage tail-like protein
MSSQPTSAAPAATAQPGVPDDPYRNYNFKFEVNGQVLAHFVQVEGLGFTVERILWRAGGDNSRVRTLPGRVDYHPVTLRYGLTGSMEMMTWLQGAVTGRVERPNVTIALIRPDSAGEVRRWNLISAWPCAWQGAQLDALGNEVAIESLTVSYDRLEIDPVGS